MKIKAIIPITLFLLTIAIFWLINSNLFSSIATNHQIKDVPSLIAAVNNGTAGKLISLAPGNFELTEPLLPKPGMSIIGAGSDRTTITAVSSWQTNTDELPAVEAPQAYLVNLSDVNNVTISNIKLTAKNLHGAIYAKNADGLELDHLHLEDFLWSSVRTISTDKMKIHDNVFVDAGDRYGATAGGAIYMNWTKDSEFWNNKIFSLPNSTKQFFGFKGNKGTNLRFHHNDIRVDFSLEFPFASDRNIEIDHNIFQGAVSIPKQAGGSVVEGELTYHIHHNWFKQSYALEWSRNNVEIDHNFFDFDLKDDAGNLIANFSKAASPGFTLFHDNLIRNPGRGIFWTQGIYNRFSFYNNHVQANNLTRLDGFFGFHPLSDFTTIEIKNNIIENTAKNPRPLMRNRESYSASIENNLFKNIEDTSFYKNNQTNSPKGLRQPLSMKLGINNSCKINNWHAICGHLENQRK